MKRNGWWIGTWLLWLWMPGVAVAQTIGELPAVPAPEEAAADAADSWTVEHVEAPGEIALGTMAVNVWARVNRTGSRNGISGLTLVVQGEGGPARLALEPLDGAFDSGVEDGVVTVDTYTWVRDAAHEWELWGQSAESQPQLLTRGVIRLKPRVSSPDLVLVDQDGFARPWIASGAGGFSPSPPVDAGRPLAAGRLVDVDGDGRADLLVPSNDGTLRIYTNRGAGRLEPTRVIGYGPDIAATAIGDLDGDGGVDLVTAGSSRLLEIRRDLADVPDQIEDLGLAPDHVAIVDLTGDRHREICVALLGLTEGEVEVWGASPDDSSRRTHRWTLSPPEGGRGRVRALVPLAAGGGLGEALLILSGEEDEGVLESWSGPADTESVRSPTRTALIRGEGEPLGAVSGRFSDPASASWLVWVRKEGRVELLEVPRTGTPRWRGELHAEPAAVAVLDLDGDGDDDLATGGEDLRLWINVQGEGFREAGESPYLLEAPVVALVTGSLDE